MFQSNYGKPNPKPPKKEKKKTAPIKRGYKISNYKQLYWEFFGYKVNDFIACEICGTSAVDIHHIECRGMGGTSKKEEIENLIALCRAHHEALGDKKQFKEMLIERHLKFINNYVK